nr:hypothetical protein [Bacteroidota bacterium]
MRSFKLLIIVLAATISPAIASAFHIHVYGIVTDHFSGDPIRNVQVVLVKDSIQRETISTAWNGKYELYLERGYAYEIHFKREGMVTKFVAIDAREIPLFPDVPFFEMDLQMSMFGHIADYDLSIFDEPVGRAEYKHSVRNLNWNVDYTEARRTQLIRVMIGYE